MADDDLQQRFAALSVPEFRRRVDAAIGYVHEIRREIAVHIGMSLEQAKGPIPDLDPERAKRAFQEISEMLPLLRKPLTPEERAKLIRPTARENELMKEALDEMTADPAAFDEAAKELGIELSSEQLIAIRDEMTKVDMLGELEAEMKTFYAELLTFREREVKVAEALRDAIVARRGQS